MKYTGIWFLSVLALRVIFGWKSVLMTLSQPLALSNLSTWDSYSFSEFPDFGLILAILTKLRWYLAILNTLDPLIFQLSTTVTNFQIRHLWPLFIFNFWVLTLIFYTLIYHKMTFFKKLWNSTFWSLFFKRLLFNDELRERHETKAIWYSEY